MNETRKRKRNHCGIKNSLKKLGWLRLVFTFLFHNTPYVSVDGFFDSFRNTAVFPSLLWFVLSYILHSFVVFTLNDFHLPELHTCAVHQNQRQTVMRHLFTRYCHYLLTLAVTRTACSLTAEWVFQNVPTCVSVYTLHCIFGSFNCSSDSPKQGKSLFRNPP